MRGESEADRCGPRAALGGRKALGASGWAGLICGQERGTLVRLGPDDKPRALAAMGGGAEGRGGESWGPRRGTGGREQSREGLLWMLRCTVRRDGETERRRGCRGAVVSVCRLLAGADVRLLA